MIVVAALVLTVPAILLRAWVLIQLWGWFIVTGFGAAPLGMLTASGLFLVAHLFTADHEKTEPTWDALAGSVAFSVMAPLFMLLLGWVFRAMLGGVA